MEVGAEIGARAKRGDHHIVGETTNVVNDNNIGIKLE